MILANLSNKKIKAENFKTMTRKALKMTSVSKITGKAGKISSISTRAMEDHNMAMIIQIKTEDRILIKRLLLVKIRIIEVIKVIKGTRKCRCQCNKSAKTNFNSTNRISPSIKSRVNSRTHRGKDKASRNNLWVNSSLKITRTKWWKAVDLKRTNRWWNLIKDRDHNNNSGVVQAKNAWDQMTRLDATWIP